MDLNKIIDRLIDDKGTGVVNEDLQDEINNLYQKKREQAARIEQAMERISELETQVFENQEGFNKNKLAEKDIHSLRSDLADKIEDLKLRQDQDLAQTNNRLMKRIDDLQAAIEDMDKNVDEIERRRLAGENNILKKSMQILREGNIEGEILDLKRRIKDIEHEVNKPKEKQIKLNIEKEEIIKEIVQGMAQFEKDINDMKKQLAEHDRDIQDTAKLIHVLDLEKTKDQEKLENLRNRVDDLDHLKEIVKKDRIENTQNLDELRLACESEFNNVKKAEITDFKNLNTKVNELIVLQDVVEQIADQVEFMQKEIEGVRREHGHTPVRMKNKVAADNLTSSMTPSTMLFSDLKNRRSTFNIDEEIGMRPKRGGLKKGEGPSSKNISFDLSDRRASPMTDKVRESLFTKSRLTRHLADMPPDRQRDYIQIDNENWHKKDLQYKLRGESPEDPDRPEKRKEFA